MFRQLLAFFIGIIPFLTSAQVTHWYGLLNEPYINLVLTSPKDSASHRYFGGFFNGNVDLDPNPQNQWPVDPWSWENPFVGKLKNDYALDWIRTIDCEAGRITRLLATDDGGLLVLMQAERWVDLDPGPNTLIIENPFSATISILCKWDAQGNPEWYWNLYPGASGNMYLALHPDGGYLVHGTMTLNEIRSPADTIVLPDASGSYILLHFAEDGALLDFKRVGGATGGAIVPSHFSFPPGEKDHFYFAGNELGEPQLTVNGSSFVFPPNSFNYFVSKVSYSGELLGLQWMERFTSSTNKSIRLYGIQEDDQGGLYVSGIFIDTLLLNQSTDPISLISINTTPNHGDLFVARLDSHFNWLWVHQLQGGYDFFFNRTNGLLTSTTDNGVLLVASTLNDVYLDPHGINKRLLTQEAGCTAFAMRFDAEGRAGCAFPLMAVDTTYPELLIYGMDRLDSFRYYLHGIYPDSLTFFDGTKIPAGSRASYMIDASFCPEYPCADIEVAACGDTLRACTWSATSWRWYKDGQHLMAADGDSLLLISENGTYTLVAWLDDGCPYQRPDTAQVRIDHFLPFELTSEPINCHWGQAGAIQIQPGNGTGPFRFRLDSLPFQTVPRFEGLSAGTYTVTIGSEAHGCVYSDTLTIDSLSATRIDAYRCHGDTLWVSNTPFFQGQTDTILLLQSTAHPGCDSAVWVQARFTAPTVQSIQNQFVCDSAEVGVDTLVLTHFDLSCDSLILIQGRVWAPSWALDSILWLCLGDSLYVDNAWYHDEAIVELSLTSTQGCDSLLRMDIRLVRPPVYPPAWDTLAPAGTTITLAAPFAMGFDLEWRPYDGLSCRDCPAPELIAEEDRIYTLQFSDPQGCFDHTATYQVRVYAEEIAMPNLFTPNGDGVNDRFGVVVLKGPAASVQIHRLAVFNRWGNMVYQGQGPDAGWDGLCQGTPCPMDTYAWLLEVSFANGRRQVLRGEITLMR